VPGARSFRSSRIDRSRNAKLPAQTTANGCLHSFLLRPPRLLPYSALPERPYRPVAQDTALSRR
jgi:hypothetical protein